MPNELRKAVVQWIEVVKGGMNQTKKVNLPEKLHFSIKRSIGVIRQNYEQVLLDEQDILATRERWTKVLALLPTEGNIYTLVFDCIYIDITI